MLRVRVWVIGLLCSAKVQGPVLRAKLVLVAGSIVSCGACLSGRANGVCNCVDRRISERADMKGPGLYSACSYALGDKLSVGTRVVSSGLLSDNGFNFNACVL